MEKNSQQRAWEQEYQNPSFISNHDAPQSEVVRFAKWLKKEGTLHFGKNILQEPGSDPVNILDLGCGNGRNLLYFSDKYQATGIGVDFSPTAIKSAKKMQHDLPVRFRVGSIGDKEVYADIPDNSMDLVLDITASNALYEGERDMYLREAYRVLKPGGIMMVRSLCLDGDKNAKNLLKMYPGPEAGTYILPDQLIMERVFSEEEFLERYGQFHVVEMSKPAGYQRWANQSLKRRYIVAYLTK